MRGEGAGQSQCGPMVEKRESGGRGQRRKGLRGRANSGEAVFGVGGGTLARRPNGEGAEGAGLWQGGPMACGEAGGAPVSAVEAAMMAEERRFAELPREAVRRMAEGAGAELSEEGAALLAEDVCYRLREAAQVWGGGLGGPVGGSKGSGGELGGLQGPMGV